MKLLVGILSAALAVSAHALTIADNTKINTPDEYGIKITGLCCGYADTFIYFKKFNQTLYDQGIPHMAITIDRTGGGDTQYVVHANGYTDVNNATVAASSCEITLNGSSIDSAIRSDACELN